MSQPPVPPILRLTFALLRVVARAVPTHRREDWLREWTAELWYDVDTRSHEIVGARVLTPRLPYMGICDEPQQRARDMVGVKLDADWPGSVRARLGGRRGCFQLTDLTSDLCRLLSWS